MVNLFLPRNLHKNRFLNEMPDKNGSILKWKVSSHNCVRGCRLYGYSFLLSLNEKYCSSARMIWSRKVTRSCVDLTKIRLLIAGTNSLRSSVVPYIRFIRVICVRSSPLSRIFVSSVRFVFVSLRNSRIFVSSVRLVFVPLRNSVVPTSAFCLPTSDLRHPTSSLLHQPSYLFSTTLHVPIPSSRSLIKSSSRRPAIQKPTEDWRLLQSSVYILPI